MQSVDLDNGVVQIVGALDFDRSQWGILPRRLPDWTRPQIPGFMEIMVRSSSGIRLEFQTSSRNLELDVLTTGFKMPNRSPVAAFDLVVDSVVVDTRKTPEGNKIVLNLANLNEFEIVEGSPATIRFEGLASGSKRCEIWLPTNAATELRALRVDDGATFESVPARSEKRWVHHGSSISHCSEAASPTQTWPVVAARLAGLDVRNLGFGGNCHLDQFVARTIRDEPADCISLKIGINVVNMDSLKERTFAPALHGFLDTIREGKPDTPVVVVSPIICPNAEDTPGPTVPNADGQFVTFEGHEQVRRGSLTLVAMRRIIENVVEGRRERGDAGLHYLDGLALFGADDVDDLPDALHPNAAGYVRMGERFFQHIFAENGILANAI